MLDRIHGEQLLRTFAEWSDELAWVVPWRLVSLLGSPAFFTMAVPLLYAFAGRARANRFAAWFLTSSLVSEILKAAIARPRLDPAALGSMTSLEHGGEFESASLPSGHVLTATVVWGAIGLRARRPWVRAACWALVPLMGLSRMALLRHDLLDVFAGLLVGAVVLGMALTFERVLVPRLSPLPWVEQAGLWTLAAMAASAAWPLHAVAVAAGVLAGLMSGAAWAHARGLAARPRLEARAWVAAALGLVGAGAARTAGHRWWTGADPTALVASFLLYGVAGLWISGGVPAFLQRWRRPGPPESDAAG